MKRMVSEDVAAVAGAGDAAAGGVPEAARRPLRELMDDRLLDVLLERSRDQADGLRLTGESSMLGELVRAAMERALESELTAHLGYGRGRAGRQLPQQEHRQGGADRGRAGAFAGPAGPDGDVRAGPGPQAVRDGSLAGWMTEPVNSGV
jgi:hypothetical protein